MSTNMMNANQIEATICTTPSTFKDTGCHISKIIDKMVILRRVSCE